MKNKGYVLLLTHKDILRLSFTQKYNLYKLRATFPIVANFTQCTLFLRILGINQAVGLVLVLTTTSI